jgi:hypothetical protein
VVSSVTSKLAVPTRPDAPRATAVGPLTVTRTMAVRVPARRRRVDLGAPGGRGDEMKDGGATTIPKFMSRRLLAFSSFTQFR